MLAESRMTSPTDISLEALYELHREWENLVAHREVIRSQPYDPYAEADLVDRLEKHQQKLSSMRDAILRQTLKECDASSFKDAPQRVAG